MPGPLAEPARRAVVLARAERLACDHAALACAVEALRRREFAGDGTGEGCGRKRSPRRVRAMLYAILILILILAVVGAIPSGPIGWGYAPSGVLTLVVVILLILALTGRL
jgi:hypothetical protein